MIEDKIGECEICEKENIEVKYSYTIGQWLCEECYDYTAERMWNGD